VRLPRESSSILLNSLSSSVVCWSYGDGDAARLPTRDPTREPEREPDMDPFRDPLREPYVGSVVIW